MRFRLSYSTSLLFAITSLFIALFALFYPYSESVGMNFLSPTEHPIIAVVFGLLGLASFLALVGFGIWFVVALVQDVLRYREKRGQRTPPMPELPDITKLQPDQAIKLLEAYTVMLKQLASKDTDTKGG